MAVSFKVPASPKRSIFNIDQFLGVDMTNSGTNIDERMSPNAPNMIRDVPGKVRKRMGYFTHHNFGSGVVYGAHVLKSTSTNTGDFVTKRNMSLIQNVNIEIEEGESIYIYSDLEIPVGLGVHIQFTYTTDKDLSLCPYVSDSSSCTDNLFVLNSATDYHGAFGFDDDVHEPFNAFQLSNEGTGKATVALRSVMIYFTENSAERLNTYQSYQTVNEQALYKKGNYFTYADSTEAISSSSEEETVTFQPNFSDEKGLLLVEFDLLLSNLSNASLADVKVEFGVTQVGGSTVQTTLPTFDLGHSRKMTVSRVVDPAYDHSLYLVDSSYLSEIYVTVKVSGYTTWTCNVALKNFKATKVTRAESFYSSGGKTLIHIDNLLYAKEGDNYSLLSENMNRQRSKSWQFENRLFIVDGNTYWIYDGDNDVFTEVLNSSYAKIPITRIGCTPDGAGVSYYAKNLLSYGFEQRYTVSSEESSTKVFSLMWDNLTDDPLTVQVMTNGGSMNTLTEGTDYTVNRSTGTVTFVTAPGETPITGEDNVYITAFHTPDSNSSMSVPECINKCTIGALFGVGGATDRLFLSGNPEHPNVDWYSDQYDPTYFPDTAYSKLGRDTSAIVGYSMINNYLAAHKDENETEQSVFVREGDLVATGETTNTSGDQSTSTYDTEPAFKLINTLQGAGAIAPYSFGYLKTEPLFLTRSGIFAITPQDMTGEKYAQNRSFYVNGRLTVENALEEAFAITYNDMYFLFINSKAYVLDGLQALPTAQGEPYATRQYACFYLTDVPVNVAWTENETLWFGTSDGRVCTFYTDETDVLSYSDSGTAIEAWWETPDLDGSLFYKNKAFRYIAVRLKATHYSRVKLWSMSRGVWTRIKEKAFSDEIFRFSTLVFSSLTFNNDTSDPVMSAKIRVRRVDKARFKVENSNLNEPFGIHDFALEYVQNGNYKG